MEFQDEELKEILNIFNTESDEIIERLNNTLLELEKQPENKDLIVLLFRDAHSLKGAARMIGFEQTQSIAHLIEDILGLAKEDKLTLTSEIADVLYKSVDLISKIIKQSIDSGKEKFINSEVQHQIDLLKSYKIEDKSDKRTDEAGTPIVLNSENYSVKNNADNINYLIIEMLIYIIKLADNRDNGLISELLDVVSKLLKYFEQADYFEIKNELETIKLKLDVVLKFNSELTLQELEEIQKRTDKVLNELISFYKKNNLEIIDYYGYAFDERHYDKVIKNDVLNLEHETEYDFENIKDKINSLTFSIEQIEEVITDLENISKKYQNQKINSLLEKVIDLLNFIKNANVVIEESQSEIIINALSYCYSFVNKEETNQDAELLEQQITIVKQLIEMSNPVMEVVSSSNQEQMLNPPENLKDFSKLLNTGEIKTLHVESSKLDIMVSQIGELISSKIKATKQLNEFLAIEKKIEECQKDFANLLNNFKAYEYRKNQIKISGVENSSSVFIKQFVKLFSEHNKKMNEIINLYSKQLRVSAENDTKMKKVIDDFDDMIKNIRVLPLATVFHMFGRMVRDIANERGKEIEFTINGSETSADKKIIEEIKNPLIHILRNSIDHGIETPQRRVELGKTPEGHLCINAAHVDTKIFIEVVDDGQGFNIQKIKDKALQKGFLTQDELDNLDDDEVINIVFLPGFTTGDEVTSISGRGIGMDVVKSKIAQLNGTVKVISEFNKGCRIQIEIPVTVATMSAFLINVSNQIFAIPMSVVQTVVSKRSDEIITNNDIKTFLYNGRNIPVYDLGLLLGLKSKNIDTKFKTIVVAETNNKVIGFIVDKLLGEQEILHKKLSPPIHRLKNISGITTLDSGETCLILNVLDLMNKVSFINLKEIPSEKNTLSDKKLMASYKYILFVDDSLTSRTLGKNVLTNYGFNVDIAENPIDAMNLLTKKTYDLILSDIEMPKMSGLEFLNQIKTNEMYSEIPFVIMSSLNDENTKHQAKKLGAADYIVKSQFNKDNLIKTVSDLILNDN